MKVRKAVKADVKVITDIYNESILNSTATFDTTPKTIDEQNVWFEKRTEMFPVLICEKDSGIAGWASLNQYSDRCAYAATSEISVYIDAQHRGVGVGKFLMEALLKEAQGLGYHTLLARITDGNPASEKLHIRYGFEKVGTMREVGTKFGELLDVSIYQIVFK